MSQHMRFWYLSDSAFAAHIHEVWIDMKTVKISDLLPPGYVSMDI